VALRIEPYRWARDLSDDDVTVLTRTFNAAWAEWVPGERPVSSPAYLNDDRFTAPPERVERLLARGADGGVVGNGSVEWREGPGTGFLRLMVDPAGRQSGVGRALGAALVDLARSEGRTGVTVQAAVGGVADDACRRAGLRPDLVIEHNRTDPRLIDPSLLEAWRAAGEAAAGYSLVTYDAPCPSDELAAGFVAARHALNDAPRFEGEPDATFTVEELRAVEAAAAASHHAWWSVGVRHDATGEVVGLSELYLPAERPWTAFQGDTGVDPAHRGHGLGAWMKAHNHLRLAAERPDVEVVQTWNAAANEPMLRINRALGFEPVQRFRGWFLDLG